ncbi:Swarming motility protein ybiA, partial [Termitomyces sp. J132]
RPSPRALPLRKYCKSSPPNPGSNSQNYRPILFYNKHEPYYEFTNFSDHSVRYHGHYYKTSEHLFQSLKFLDVRPDIAMKIRGTSTAREAFSIAQANKPYQRPDWLQVNINMMDIALLHKFQQHRNLKDMLLATGDAELIENSPSDAFWGNGAHKLGRNELGKALMRLRGKFQRGEA